MPGPSRFDSFRARIILLAVQAARYAFCTVNLIWNFLLNSCRIDESPTIQVASHVDHLCLKSDIDDSQATQGDQKSNGVEALLIPLRSFSCMQRAPHNG